MDVYIEAGAKRTFANAVEWPGWSRTAKDTDGALEALVACGPRYRKAIGASAARGLMLPENIKALKIVERVKGDATTDFGAPSITTKADRRPLDDAELARQIALLRASWSAFDKTAERHARATLRKGPRGGGRELPAIVAHVLEADKAYLSGLGRSFRAKGRNEMREMRTAFADMLERRAHGETPEVGPRRKKPLWTPRFAVRRSAWHALDHVWEIEDRAT